jgi:catechol 2,3-dioxygenase-like lactoylglutathione lyase family enzyme
MAASEPVKKARALGMNHVALEVDDVDAALEFYGRIFAFTLRGRAEGAAFVDMGDQFIALMEGRSQPPDEQIHSFCPLSTQRSPFFSARAASPNASEPEPDSESAYAPTTSDVSIGRYFAFCVSLP